MTETPVTELQGWSLLPVIGRGGFKIVHGIEKDGVREALKITTLKAPIGTDPSEAAELAQELRARSEREFRLLQRFQGGPVVRLGSISGKDATWNGTPVHLYSEELLPGVTLDKLVLQNREADTVPVEASIKLLFLTGIDVISRLWSEKIIHRDIKPQNIMVTGLADRPFVFFDLGIAFDRGSSSLTRHTLGPGTLSFRAPETINPDYKATLDFRSDLFSLGLTVFQYATGIHPIHHGSMSEGETVYRLIKRPAIPLRSLRPDLPEALCVLVDRCLHKRPALRPGRLMELRSSLGG